MNYMHEKMKRLAELCSSAQNDFSLAEPEGPPQMSQMRTCLVPRGKAGMDAVNFFLSNFFDEGADHLRAMAEEYERMDEYVKGLDEAVYDFVPTSIEGCKSLISALNRQLVQEKRISASRQDALNKWTGGPL